MTANYALLIVGALATVILAWLAVCTQDDGRGMHQIRLHIARAVSCSTGSTRAIASSLLLWPIPLCQTSCRL